MCVPPLPPTAIPPAQSAQRLTGNYDSRTHLAGSVLSSVPSSRETLEDARDKISHAPTRRSVCLKCAIIAIEGLKREGREGYYCAAPPHGTACNEKHWIPRLRLTTPRLRSQTRDAPSESTLAVTFMLSAQHETRALANYATEAGSSSFSPQHTTFRHN
uniref:Uncharacterized protein n=1 Tax=Timema shepardi TaxID=629360 RepID=A0A7R9B1N8_TIMSH|nr:unnamed protein product [Timema shepardi]